jgi:hypothetical protein
VRRGWVQLGATLPTDSYFPVSLKHTPCPGLDYHSCPTAVAWNTSVPPIDLPDLEGGCVELYECFGQAVLSNLWLMGRLPDQLEALLSEGS